METKTTDYVSEKTPKNHKQPLSPPMLPSAKFSPKKQFGHPAKKNLAFTTIKKNCKNSLHKKKVVNCNFCSSFFYIIFYYIFFPFHHQFFRWLCAKFKKKSKKRRTRIRRIKEVDINIFFPIFFYIWIVHKRAFLCFTFSSTR